MPNITTQVTDDQPLYYIRRDLSGGANTRQHPSNISENSAAKLDNVDIGVPGQTRKRPGVTLIEDLGGSSGNAGLGFEPAGGTNEAIFIHGAKLEGWTGSGSFVEHKTDLTASTVIGMFRAYESGVGDVLMIGNGTNNWFRMKQDHTFQDLGSTTGATASPPKSTVGAFYRNRMWVLKGNNLYCSTALGGGNYSTAFDTVSGYFTLPVGSEMGLIGVRDSGLVAFGNQQVWSINPSTVPVATDKAEKIIDIGCVAQNSIAQVGDDLFFLAPDGVRGVFRTQLDKLQQGNSYPLSYPLKDEFDTINWSYISKACAISFDNKYFLALPTGGSTTNNQVWVFYPASNAWVVINGGWNIGGWAKVKISGEERLYAIESGSGKVLRAWYGHTDNGSAINYVEVSRQDDLGQPLVKKWGGEINILAAPSNNVVLDVYANPDDLGYVFIGNVDLGTGNFVTFPTTFPVTFPSQSVIRQKFHLDDLGEWYRLQIKIQHNATNTDQIKIYERGVISSAVEYQGEE
jgi:hypothetical protein